MNLSPTVSRKYTAKTLTILHAWLKDINLMVTLIIVLCLELLALNVELKTKTVACRLWLSFRERTLKSGWICQLPLAQATPENTVRFSLVWVDHAVSNDLSVTVLSCWGPAKQTLWFGFSRIKREIPNESFCSQAIVLHPPVHGESSWICHLPSVESTRQKHSLFFTPDWRT